MARQAAEAAQQTAAESERVAMAQRSAADWLLMLLGGAAIFLLVATGLAWVAFDSHLPSKASANM